MPSRTVSDALIVQNLRLVHSIVRDVVARVPSHVNRDDLTSAGMLGLVLAARSFDETRGVPFARWAAIKIRCALLDELRSMDWASRSVRTRAREVEAARNLLAVTLSRSPLPHEVADTLGISVSELGSIDADVHRASVLSLQGYAPEVAATLMPDTCSGPEQLILTGEQLDDLYAAIAELPPRLRRVILASHFDALDSSSLAGELGVTESRISQMRTQAYGLLRLALAAMDPTMPVPELPGGRTRRARADRYVAAVESRRTA